jgi:protein SCO1/2
MTWWPPLVVGFVALGLVVTAAAARGGGREAGAERHCAQRAAPARYALSVARYRVPDLVLRNQENEAVSLATALDQDAAVALNFVFTSCSTICPVMTATFARMRKELGDAADGLRMVSISIDPEHDTPAVLKDYARRFGTGTSWELLTGDPDQIVAVLKAFDAFAGSKTNHQPLTFLRTPGRTDWVRIQGLASASELAAEYRKLAAESRADR